jgi:threonine dehydrogenase-like Zn-dependent dehydrogenase
MKALTWHGRRDVRVDTVPVDGFATHHVPLADAPQAYETFQKEDGAFKVVFRP